MHPPAKHGGAAPPPARKPPQIYETYRPTYRAPPPKRRHRRRCNLCCCCCWLILLLLALALLAAIAGGIFCVLYRPHRPTFSLSSLSLPVFNLTAANSLNSKLNVSLTARNPNKKLIFDYDEISVSATANGVNLGDGIFPPFVQAAGNTTLLKATVGTAAETLEAPVASDLKKKNSLAIWLEIRDPDLVRLEIQIRLETKAAVMLGNLKTRRAKIRVSCRDVSVPVPKRKNPPPISPPDALCDVELRIKIWNWYL